MTKGDKEEVCNKDWFVYKYYWRVNTKKTMRVVDGKWGLTSKSDWHVLGTQMTPQAFLKPNIPPILELNHVLVD